MHLLQHKNPFVRQAARGMLQVPRIMQFYARTGCPVIANSFPKSGTHLLDQIVSALPDVARYGRFLSSMHGSFFFRERTQTETVDYIATLAPRELLRAHLFFDDRYAEALARHDAAHFFIYRDPRDVVVSEAFYLRDMNPWHKLHRYFRGHSDQDALLMAIRGIRNEQLGASYPDIGTRFSRYAGWLNQPETMAIQFEELTSDHREGVVRRMVSFYCRHQSGQEHDVDRLARDALNAIQPTKSHTFRKGRSGAWRRAFDQRCREEFKSVAGDLLIDLGYETDRGW